MSYRWQKTSDTEQDKEIKQRWTRTLNETRAREQTRDWSDSASERGANFMGGLLKGKSEGIKRGVTSALKTLAPRPIKRSKRRNRQQTNYRW